MSHHVFARADWAEPLARQGQVDGGDVPDVAEAVGADHDWLEVAVIPDDALVWVIRDGDLVNGDVGGEA